jgi:formate hydrogenlyase transcriptional activator
VTPDIGEDQDSGGRMAAAGHNPPENGPASTASRLPKNCDAIPSAILQMLIESEQFLTAYFRASRVGLGIVDRDFRYVRINDTLAEMNGLPASAHLGKTVQEVLGDCAGKVEPLFKRVLATGEPISDIEVSFTLPTRSEAGHWLLHYVPIKDENGSVAYVGGIVVEVTERKKLEGSLRGVAETLEQEKKRHQVVTEVSRLLEKQEDVRRFFPQISAYLRRVLRQEYAALCLRDDVQEKLVEHALDFPLQKWPNGNIAVNIGEHPGGGVLKEQAALILNREQIQRFQSPLADRLLTEGLRSLCCVPLIRPTAPLGLIVLGSTRGNAFKDDDLSLLNQVAAMLAIALENAGTAREVEQLKIQLGREKRYLEREPRTRAGFEGIIGESPAFQKILDQIEIVAESDATVLLLGETGTGKGLVASALHEASKRRGRPLVSLNCAAIPTGLLESELFGHEKGAFTGAVGQRVGRMELADHGTLFLDEIGEISRELQPKLLRVLQDQEFERLGSSRTIKVNMRLIAATNRDLSTSVANNEFRSDLYYRLNVFPIRLPALRERRGDIPDLVHYFVHKFAARLGRTIKTIPEKTMEALTQWDWPGNVRELENIIERSVILTADDETALRVPLEELTIAEPTSRDRSLEDAERAHIIEVLRETGGILSGPDGAANRLGLKRTTLQSKMDKLGISRRDYCDPFRA